MDVFVSEDCYPRDSIMAAVYHISKILFMGIQVTFLISEDEMYIKHGRTNTGRNVYIVNAIVDFTYVIFGVLYDTKPVIVSAVFQTCLSSVKAANYSSAAFNHTYACISHDTDIDRTLSKMERYLFPFHSEFCIMAISLNLILWRRISSKTPQVTSRKYRKARRKRSPRIRSKQNVRSGIRRTETAPPDVDSDMSSLEKGRLLPTENESSDSDTDTVDTDEYIDANEEITTFINGKRDCQDRDIPNTTSRSSQGPIEGSEVYGSMDGCTTTSNLRTPGPDSQRTGGWLEMCCHEQCKGCLDPSPRHIYGPDNGCGFIAFLGFALICVDTVMSLMLQSKELGKMLFTPLYILDTAELILMLVMTILLSESCRRKLQIGPTPRKTLSVGSIVLIISTFIIFMYDVLEGLAAVNMLILPPNSTWVESLDRELLKEHYFTLRTQNVLDILISIIYIAQVAIQTNLVLRIHWIMKRNWFDDAISSSIVMQCAFFLMGANFAQWFVGTVVEIQHPEVGSQL
jgi:hypothetical protein